MIQMRPITQKVIDASVELYESVVDRIEARDAVGAEKVWSEDRPKLSAVVKRLAANDRDFAIYHG
jgi:hypothetical protein